MSDILAGLLPIVALITGSVVVVRAIDAGINGVMIASYMSIVSAIASGGVMYQVGKRSGR